MSRSRKSKEPLFKGSTVFTLLFGLILGVGIAAGVAFYVTQVPMPFADKFSRANPTQPMPDPRDAPDPNRALSGRVEPAQPVPGTPGATSGSTQGGSLQDDIGALLTTLGAPAATAPATSSTPPPALASASPPASGSPPAPNANANATGTRSPAPASGSGSAAAPPPASAPAAGTQTTYYLQAGAFRTEADAQAMQARLLMLGMQSTVQPVQVNGSTLHRVRVGPFKGIDEMNRTRATLSNAKIETSVVRP